MTPKARKSATIACAFFCASESVNPSFQLPFLIATEGNLESVFFILAFGKIFQIF